VTSIVLRCARCGASFTPTRDDLLLGPEHYRVASGDVLWVSSGTNTIAKWDGEVGPGGYGAVAIDIAGDLSPYLGIGQRDGAVANVHTAVATGPGTCEVKAWAKATANTMTLASLVLSADATPRS
jgi:hypothetical protein